MRLYNVQQRLAAQLCDGIDSSPLRSEILSNGAKLLLHVDTLEPSALPPDGD